NDFHPFAAGQAGQAGQANQAGQAGQANQAGQAEQGLEIFECLGSDSGPAYTVISYGKTKNEAESKKKKAEALILSQK
ncbi:MAG: hypothetical protein FWE78_02955, partial [Methanimicrococcus sp.]|nr:hypothetical protein [Methanimicrococcus sp.]